MMRRASRRVLVCALTRAAATSTAACSAADGPLPYTLLSKTRTSPDAWLLRFSLPPSKRFLGEDPTLPTCITVAYPDGTNEAGTPMVLEKSYSPVSHPALEGVVYLLVKAYVPRPGGGVGSFICNLEIGETMQATLKKKRMIHGSAEVTRRWRTIGLVGGGTGIAPLIQIARIVLDDPHDLTTVRMLSINRHEEDVLMKAELDAMAAAHPERFQVAYSLTGPVYSGWPGFTGRGSMAMIQSALPPPGAPNGSTMIFVCGTDGFVDTWGGKTGRGPKKADGSKGPKIQGPLTGLLAEAGFHEAEVFKY